MAACKRDRSPHAFDRSSACHYHNPLDRTYTRDLLKFDARDQPAFELGERALGGNTGLTVIARVRRTHTVGSPDWDRLIDFGNGESKENIVINFQNEMMYEVRGEDGAYQKLEVGTTDACAPSSIDTFRNNEWVHISLVHGSDGTASIFWDGRLKARGPVLLPPEVHRKKCYVGTSNWEQDTRFLGDIADLHIFDYALSDREVGMCALQRQLPSDHRGRPIISVADSWREVPSPLCPLPSTLPLLMAACGRRGCGGAGKCSNSGIAATLPLHFNIGLSADTAQAAHAQLTLALDRHNEQLGALQAVLNAATVIGATREAERIRQMIANSNDAQRRAQAVARMIRYAARMPTDLRREKSTGQMRKPPKIAAAVDPATGHFHAFAIYELRSGDAAHGSRFHVYITDLFNMRSLMPSWTCWNQANAGSHIISLLQRKADAEHEVVVLRALHDDVALETYYEKIGFTARQQAFEDAGLADSYASGDMLYK